MLPAPPCPFILNLSWYSVLELGGEEELEVSAEKVEVLALREALGDFLGTDEQVTLLDVFLDELKDMEDFIKVVFSGVLTEIDHVLYSLIRDEIECVELDLLLSQQGSPLLL